MSTPNYVTKEDFRFMSDSLWNEKVLESGTFVRPIELAYVPKHIRDNPMNRWFDAEKEVYVYCSFGIIAIPKNIVRKL
jgi:hypothetical protein